MPRESWLVLRVSQGRSYAASAMSRIVSRGMLLAHRHTDVSVCILLSSENRAMYPREVYLQRQSMPAGSKFQLEPGNVREGVSGCLCSARYIGSCPIFFVVSVSVHHSYLNQLGLVSASGLK